MKKKEMVSWVAKEATLALLSFYQQTFSVLFGPCCRFTPSCSAYASLSIRRFGIKFGVWLALRRLAKCHPFHPGGCDPVPELHTNS